jgi:endonuclease G, mitochondrial
VTTRPDPSPVLPLEVIEEHLHDTEAVVPPEGLETDRSPRSQLAWNAVQKLRTLEVPTAGEAQALNSVLCDRRPALQVQDGKVEPWPKAAGVLGKAWRSFVAKVPALLGAVGRIELKNEPIGTAFAVADHLVATNHHVVDQLFPQNGALRGAGIRFEITGAGQSAELLRLTDVAAVHDSADLALVRIDPASTCPRPLPLATEPPRHGQPVLVIGYPFADYRDPAFASANFSGNLSFETLSPGRITRTGQRRSGVVEHDCQTLGGNSGSPVISLDTGSVVAVHFDGAFLDTNRAIPVDYLSGLMQQG